MAENLMVGDRVWYTRSNPTESKTGVATVKKVDAHDPGKNADQVTYCVQFEELEGEFRFESWNLLEVPN